MQNGGGPVFQLDATAITLGLHDILACQKSAAATT